MYIDGGMQLAIGGVGVCKMIDNFAERQGVYNG